MRPLVVGMRSAHKLKDTGYEQSCLFNNNVMQTQTLITKKMFEPSLLSWYK